ncbi:MAG: hypothetical protein WBK51_15930 [Polaromonas sp.]
MPFDSHQANNPTQAFNDLMARGTAAHAAGDPIKALTAFEAALSLNPQNTHATSAYAALLFEQARPRAAFTLLQGIESQLLLDADGCANLGLAALSCNQELQASAYFEKALQLQPTHAAALTHLGMLAAREQRWLDAIDLARQCVASLPNDVTGHSNLMDYLLGARCSVEALAQFETLSEALKDHPQIAIRRVVALALNAEFDAANQAMSRLNPLAMTELANFLQRGGATDLQSLFYRRALDAMQTCDWRDYDRLCAVVGKDRIHQGLPGSPIVVATDKTKTVPPFTAMRSAVTHADKIRIGIAATSLRDAAATQALAAELSLYDASQFTFHIYSPTPQPHAILSAPLAAHSVVEIAHFSDEEAVWRIRLDRLDIWFDLTVDTPWHRPGIAQHRVAPLQVLPLSGQQSLSDGSYDYALSDRYLQEESSAKPSSVALAHLPYACWTTAPAAVVANPSRQTVGLADEAFVVCVFGPCAHISPQIFSDWMQLLSAVPNTVLWLSHASPNTQANLRREALQAGIAPERIIFLAAAADMQNMLPLADLFLGTPGSHHALTLVATLRSGVPAIAAASPMANSVLSAAGLEDCYFNSTEVCLAKALELAQNPNALKALRERMHLTVALSPLFGAANRANERAKAWTLMVQRSRAGFPPTTFDVPMASTSG